MDTNDHPNSWPAKAGGGAWPVCWSAVWVGALAALAFALVAGLSGLALGVHMSQPGKPLANWREVSFSAWPGLCAAPFWRSLWVVGWPDRSAATADRSLPCSTAPSLGW